MATSEEKDKLEREMKRDPKGETYHFPKVEGLEIPSKAGEKK